MQRTPKRAPLAGLVVPGLLFGFGRLAVNVGLLAPGTGPLTVGACGCALEPLAFPLGRSPLAFVGKQLSLVSQSFAAIGCFLALISDEISSVREQFAPSDLSLPARERLLTLIRRVSLVFSGHTPA